MDSRSFPAPGADETESLWFAIQHGSNRGWNLSPSGLADPHVERETEIQRERERERERARERGGERGLADPVERAVDQRADLGAIFALTDHVVRLQENQNHMFFSDRFRVVDPGASGYEPRLRALQVTSPATFRAERQAWSGVEGLCSTSLHGRHLYQQTTQRWPFHQIPLVCKSTHLQSPTNLSTYPDSGFNYI